MRSLFLGCALLIATTTVAQPIKFGFGVQGNAANLNVAGTLKDVYGMGYGGGAHLDVKAVMFSVRLSGDYIAFSPDNDKYRSIIGGLTGSSGAGFSVDGGKITILSAALSAKLGILPLPIINPYITGGGGFARLSQDKATVKLNGADYGNVPEVAGETNGMAHVGVGVDLNFGGLALYGEAKYTWIFTAGETSTYIPFTIGITF